MAAIFLGLNVLTHRDRVTHMRVPNYGNLSLGQMMACRLVDTKPLPMNESF